MTAPVKARRFEPDGDPAGPEILVTSSGYLPALAALPDGGFVAVWQLFDPGSTESPLFARIFRPDGSPAGPAFAVGAQGYQATVSADAAGGFVVAWQDSASGSLLVRRFEAAGRPAGDPQVVQATRAVGSVREVQVARRPDGSFLVLWHQSTALPAGGATEEALARIYDAEGAPVGAPFRVHDETRPRHFPGNAAATADGWLVSWGHLDASGPVFAPALSARHLTACAGLCLQGGRFRAEATWHVPATGQRGTASPVVLTGDTGTFWFFSPDNTELIVKVLDGQAINGHFWVFYGSLTDVEFDLTVIDTLTGRQRTWHNPAGTLASRADTEAFP